MSWKGKFHPKNPQKYLGDVTNIIWRSLWEQKVMLYLDKTDAIVAWKSEETVIPYFDPVKQRQRRYFPDFYVKVKTKDGILKEYIWEVKPHKQTIPPTKPGKVTKRYIHDVLTYGTNEAKFEAATQYCKDRGWEFKVLTEHHLGIGRKSRHK